MAAAGFIAHKELNAFAVCVFICASHTSRVGKRVFLN